MRKLLIALWTATAILLLTAGTIPAASEELAETRIYCDQVIGQIKPGINGVSMGGEAESYLKPGTVAAMKDVGIGSLRLESITANLTLKIYDPKTGKYDWTDLDKEIENIQAGGAQIIANIFYTPEFLSSDPEGKRGRAVHAVPKDYKLWAKYVSDIVRHVNRDRKFGIKYWEIWNEPSGNWFFTSWYEGKENFWKLYDVTARAVKRADPSALVGGFGDNVGYPEHIADFCDYVKKNKVPCDFFTIHWYGEWEKGGFGNPASSAYMAKNTQELIFKRLGKRIPIFLTEWNLNANNLWGTKANLAAYTANALFWMQDSPIEQANFFRVEPYGAADSSVLTSDNQWRTPARILWMYSAMPRQRINTSALPFGVGVLASRDEKRVAIMVSRYDIGSTANLTHRLYIKNHGRTGNYKLTIYTEDNANADRLGKPVTTKELTGSTDGSEIVLELNLEPSSVVFVVIE